MVDENKKEQEKEKQENQEEETKSFFEWCEEHPKTVFSIRFVLWCSFAAILPFAFIAWRYDIFTNEPKIQLTGWGFIAVIILVVFVSTLIKYVYSGLKPGLGKQCIFGFVSIILPLVVLLLLINSIEDSINLFKQALGCTIICEAVGIPLNPFPSWIAKRQLENEQNKVERMSDIVLDKFFKKKKDHSEK